MPGRRPAKLFRPNERDVEILQYVADYRFTSIELLAALLVRPALEGRKYGFSAAALRARCQKLREQRFLTWQFMHDLPTGRGLHTERPAVYSIGPAAVPILGEEYGFDTGQLKRSLEKNRLSSMFLRHFLMISKFRVCLELACRQTQAEVGNPTGTIVEVSTWLQEGLQDRVQVASDDGRESIPVVPDAVFNLIVRKPDGSVAVSHFAVEADRGTMPMRSITRKATGYVHYLRQGLQKRRYTYYSEDGPSQVLRVVNPELPWDRIPVEEQRNILKYGIDPFTILFVTRGVPPDIEHLRKKGSPTRERQQNLVEVVGEVTGLGPDDARFMFCTEALDYNLSNPQPLLSKIWQSPCGTDGLRSLLVDANQS